MAIICALCAFCSHIYCPFGTLREKVISLAKFVGVAPLTTTHGNGISWVSVAIATKVYGIFF